MNDDRYAPPTTTVTDVERAQPDRPGNVIYGVRLLWLAAACSLPAIIYPLFWPPADVSPQENVLINVGALVVGFVMAYVFNGAAWRGRNWGRWVNAIMVTLSSLATFFLLLRVHNFGPIELPWYILIQYVVQNLIAMFGVGQLFTSSANAWYREMGDSR